MHIVSIIVPVYKAEAFLPVCIDSILHQTYYDIEVILVDDGSPDSCPRLCDAFAEKDPRIKVIHKENGGASSARNAGLDAATGEYICFVDSDDTVPEDSIERLYRTVTEGKGQCAVGICGIMGTETVKNNITEDTCVEVAKDPWALLSFLTKSGSYSPYAKIFDTSIIQKYNLRYDTKLNCSEDALFIRQYIRYCDKICFCAHRVYEYNMGNPNSLSKQVYPEYSTYFIKKLEALQGIVDILPLGETEGKCFLAWRALHGLYMSVNQYTRIGDKYERMTLVKRALAQLHPWFEGYENTGNEARLARWYKKCGTALCMPDHEIAAKKLIMYARVDSCVIKIKMLIARVLGH